MNVSQPLVSVIIPFYNCQYVNQAIESVLTQTYKKIEVIVVNDGSTKCQELVEPYLSKITYVVKENGGVASALNVGIQHAKGDYIAWLSSDDLFASNKIELQLSFMIRRKAEISFTNFNLMDEQGIITHSNMCKFYRNHLEVLQSLVHTNPINGCTVMMSKRLVEVVGLFNERFKYAQDYDYWVRAGLLYPIHYFPVTLINYRVHSQMGSMLYTKDQMEEFEYLKGKYKERLIRKMDFKKRLTERK